MKNDYTGLHPDRFKDLLQIYSKFLDNLEKVDVKPISVYKPLTQKHLDEINLIREVSKDLQKKKEEDIKKAAQAAKEADKEQEEKTEEKPEDKKEN